MKIITFNNEVCIIEQEITHEIAGQKAMGLLKIPEKWRLPFFVVDKSIYHQYCKLVGQERETFLRDVQKKIICIKDEIDIEDCNSKIIIRSSGSKEGMKERGKFDSGSGKIKEVVSILESLFLSIIKDNDQYVSEQGISFIIQRYIENSKLGHLSNESRFVKERRDFRFEEVVNCELNDSYNVGVRIWRTQYKIEELSNSVLLFSEKSEFKDKLRRIAYYCFSEFEKRLHLELIWNEQRLYIAQVDQEEDDDSGDDPSSYPIHVINCDEFNQLSILREVTEEDSKKFHKIRNIFIYKSIGLKTHPLYILDNQEVIQSVSEGFIPISLKNDIEKFLPNSIVIRSDINSLEKQETQLLPRSNELRDYKEVEKWLVENSKELKKNKYEFIFLIHVFIPAHAAAFACAKPNDRIVEIQSLWGLPEGLYYNSHDTFVVDTKSRYAEFADNKQITIKKTLDYKARYIAPDKNGKWMQKEIKKDFSWKQSITNKQILTIAIESRRIAEAVNQPISIMWFVGIDKEYYSTDCLAWYHEEHDNNTYSYGIYKKKYNTDEELVVKDLEDLEKLKNSVNVKIIWINPKEDSILRGKNFLDEVGKIAKEKNLTIGLKGSVLAHPLYQLLRNTNKIVLLKETKSYIDHVEYNKLVRDKIPEIIKDNLEDFECAKASGEALVRAYLEKLIEELYEVYDSTSVDELLKEFVDVEEICSGLEKAIKQVLNLNSLFFRNLKINVGNRIKLLDVINSIPHNKFSLSKCLLNNNYGHVIVSWNREALGFMIELKFCKNFEKVIDDITEKKECLVDKETIGKMLLCSFKMQREKSIPDLLKAVKYIEQNLICLKRKSGVSKDEINSIREKKREKVGGFDQGYILIKAGFLKGKQDKERRSRNDDLIGFDYEMNEETQEIQILEYKSNNYIDFRTGENQELLIRANFPLSMQKWEYIFEGEKVRKYFGNNNILILACERTENGELKLSVYLSEREKYKQLTLE